MISLKRPVMALLALVIILNGYMFLFAAPRSSEYEISKLVAEMDDKSGSSLASTRSSVVQKAQLRPYFDDRINGFLAVSKSPGTDLDSDLQTVSMAKALAAKEPGVSVHTIRQYVHDPASSAVTLQDIEGNGKFAAAFSTFMDDLMKTIEKHRPAVSPMNNDQHYAQAKEEDQLPHREGRIPLYGGHLRELYLDEPVRSKEYLSYFFRPTENEVSELQSAHRGFLEEMPSDLPPQIYEYGKLSQFMTGDGIVYLGGGKYSQLALLSISVLREAGCVLPVEVILPKRSDFDMDFCSQALPSLNARCKVMEDYLPKTVSETLQGYQLKNVALLVSSFQNVLYLDADNIPIKNPDHMFVNEPFLSKRMVVWPDLWRRSTSPYYYTIADIETDESFKMRNSYTRNDQRGKSRNPMETSFHDTKGTIPEASSETGQFLIDKKKHFRTLVLSMYYNYYGFDYYYPLFSQGAAGEGDKETFVAAAHKLELPYYQVSEFNREFGPLAESGKHMFFGMGQYDPIIDYLESITPGRTAPFEGKLAQDENDASISNYERHFYRSHSLMFLHANWPKYLLEELFLHNSNGRGMKKITGERRRLYTGEFLKESSGLDIEMSLMHHIQAWFCDASLEIQHVPAKNSAERAKVCAQVQEQMEFLRKNSE